MPIQDTSPGMLPPERQTHTVPAAASPMQKSLIRVRRSPKRMRAKTATQKGAVYWRMMSMAAPESLMVYWAQVK